MNNITIYDILLSLSYANDTELKDDIVSILEESGLLDEIEINALDVFIKKCMDLDGIPKPETLASFDVMYQNANKIISTSIEDFTKIFISNKKKKNLQLALTDAALNLTKSDSDINEIIEKLNGSIELYGNNVIEENNVSNLDNNFYEELTKPDLVLKGVPIGIAEIDEVFPGIIPGSITVIAGYTGSMKTTLGVNVCYNAITEGKNVLYISLEVSKRDLMYNILSKHSLSCFEQYTRDEVKELSQTNKEKFKELYDSFNKIEGKFKIIDESDITDYSISAFNLLFSNINKELIEKTGKPFDILVIDHMQLLKFDENHKKLDPYQVVNNFTSNFRRYAVKNNIGLILISQTSRDGYKYASKGNRGYLLTGLAEANELERAATGVITLLKDELGSTLYYQLLKSRFSVTLPEVSSIDPNDFKPEYYSIGKVEKDLGPVFKQPEAPIVAESDTENAIPNMDLGGMLNDF